MAKSTEPGFKTLTATSEFYEWAKHALHGADQAGMMLGEWGMGNDGPDRMRFALQIGHFLLAGKPLYLTAPHGAKIPAGLARAVDGIEYYDPNNEESFKAALRNVAEKAGRPVRQ